ADGWVRHWPRISVRAPSRTCGWSQRSSRASCPRGTRIRRAGWSRSARSFGSLCTGGMMDWTTEWLPGLIVVYAAVHEVRVQLAAHRQKANEARVKRLDSELTELAKYVMTLRHVR